MRAPGRLLRWTRAGALLVSGAAVVGLVAFAFGRMAATYGVYDLTRDAGFADHHPPPPDPRSEEEMESLRRFPPGAVALQPLIDATPTGGVLHLAPAVYAAPGLVKRAMRIEGEPGAIVDGGGIGSILTVTADDAQVIGLTLRNSGERHESTDSAIRLRAARGLYRDNTIEDCLFGFDLKQADMNIIRRNRITSKPLPEALRGDSIRVWYSNGNRIEDNDISRVRDTVVWYAKENVFAGNRIRDSRYGVHLMYSHRNRLTANSVLSSTVGMFLMYSNDNTIVDNVIRGGQGPSSIGIGFKETSRAHVEHNDIYANARGLYLDASPDDPDGPNVVAANRLAYNGVAVAFHSTGEGSEFGGNSFVGNHSVATVSGGGSADRNRWTGNFWDGYDGFDRNRDGVGDTPYRVWSWADRLWMDVPDAQFFRSAPSLELIDLVERLGSLTEPRLLLNDPAPRIAPAPDAGALDPVAVEARG
mgnify:CR=1 FL=1